MDIEINVKLLLKLEVAGVSAEPSINTAQLGSVQITNINFKDRTSTTQGIARGIRETTTGVSLNEEKAAPQAGGGRGILEIASPLIAGDPNDSGVRNKNYLEESPIYFEKSNGALVLWKELNLGTSHGVHADDGFDHVVEFTETKRGKPRLTHDGFHYLKNCSSKSTVNWICAKHKSNCKARATTKDVEGLQMIKLNGQPHNHQQD